MRDDQSYFFDYSLRKASPFWDSTAQVDVELGDNAGYLCCFGCLAAFVASVSSLSWPVLVLFGSGCWGLRHLPCLGSNYSGLDL